MIVGTDQHRFVGDEFRCKGVLGNSEGPVCDQVYTDYIHRPWDMPKTDAKDLTEPAITEWRAALSQSTSAQLRETQAALFASQQDLTRMQAERDALALHNAELKAEVLQAGTDRVKHAEREQQLRRMLTDAERDLKAAGDDAEKRAAEQARYIAGVEHDLEHARFERDRARTWQVARNDDTGDCFLCGQPIVRGQAVEPQPGTTKGSYAHVHCPTPTPPAGCVNCDDETCAGCWGPDTHRRDDWRP